VVPRCLCSRRQRFPQRNLGNLLQRGVSVRPSSQRLSRMGAGNTGQVPTDHASALAVASFQRGNQTGAAAWMASHSTAIPSRVGFAHGDSSLMRFQHRTSPNFGRRLHRFAATNPTVPHGAFQGESIFNPMPLHPAPPGLPTTPRGCVDICQIIAPHVTVRQRTRAGELANRISQWANNSVASDGRQYEAQSADGIVRIPDARCRRASCPGADRC